MEVLSLLPWLLLFYPLVDLLASILHALFIAAIKWVVIGRYKEGDYPFYGSYHFKWVLMMVLMQGADNLKETAAGTLLMSALYRLFGAKVGRNCCLFTSHMEYDLISLGSYTTIGQGVSHQCHTVERMVIKLAPFTTGQNCTLRNEAVVMPGSEMEENSTLLELSQILKGLTIGAGHTWGGLPGSRVRLQPPPSAPSRPALPLSPGVEETPADAMSRMATAATERSKVKQPPLRETSTLRLAKPVHSPPADLSNASMACCLLPARSDGGASYLLCSQHLLEEH